MKTDLSSLSGALALGVLASSAVAQTATQVQRSTAVPGGISQIVPHAGPGLAPAPFGPGSSQLGAGGWNQASVPPGLFLRAVSVATPSIAFASAELGVVLKSVDGGQSWQTVLNAGFPYYWYGVQAISAQSIVVSGFNNQTGEGVVRWSENGGASWNPPVALPGPTSGVAWLERIEFSSLSDGMTTAAWAGGVHRTQSGGRNASDWSYAQLSSGWFSGTFTYLSDGRAWTSGIDMLFSPDDGASWSPYGGTNAIFDGPVSVHNNGFGFAGGGTISPSVTGWIYSTVNAGHAWSASPVLTTPYPIRGLLALDVMRSFAVGGNHFSGVGGVWATSNGGQQWTNEVDTGSEMFDLDSVRIDNDSVRVLAVGENSEIWWSDVSCPIDAGLVATAYGFCPPASAPCGNSYESGGCVNLTGEGAMLSATGTSSATADDLVLVARQIPPNRLGVAFMGHGQTELLGGNGLIVAASAGLGLHRFPAHFADAQGVFTQGPGIVGHANAFFPTQAQIQPGQTWNFQVFYRDPTGPCGLTKNFSSGLSVTFLP